MDKKEARSIEQMRQLCHSTGMDFAKFLQEAEACLKSRVKELLTPNASWFSKGKSISRYWKFLEQITKQKWDYKDVDYWYGFLRAPSETRENIAPSLRYQVLVRDNSTCQKCGRKAPDVQVDVDHILAWSCGGPTVVDNLQVLCRQCNIGKSDECFEGGD